MANMKKVVWKGAPPNKERGLQEVWIGGTPHVFHVAPEGFVAQVDLDDDDVKEALRNPNSQIELVEKDVFTMTGSEIQLFVARSDEQTLEKVVNSCENVPWLMNFLNVVTELNQQRLVLVSRERILSLEHDPSTGLPLPPEDPAQVTVPADTEPPAEPPEPKKEGKKAKAELDV